MGRHASYAATALAASLVFGFGAREAFFRLQREGYAQTRSEGLAAVAKLRALQLGEFHRERLSDLTYYSAQTMPRSPLAQDYAGAARGDPAALARLRETLADLMTRSTGAYEGIAVLDSAGRALLRLPGDAPTPAPFAGRPPAPRLSGAAHLAPGRSVFDYEAPAPGGTTLALRAVAHGLLDRGLGEWPGLSLSAEVGEAQATPEALTRVIRMTDSGGAVYRATSRKVEGLGWIVTVKAKEDDILAPLRTQALLAGSGAAGAFALLCALFILALRSREERLRAEADAERRLLAAAIEQAGESVVITDRAGTILYANPAFSRACGYERSEVLGKNPRFLKSGRHDAAFYARLWETLLRGEPWSGRLVNRRKDGTLYEEDACLTPVRGADGAPTHFIAVKRDVTAVKSLEEQLYHAQKMEAIGRLAGGVAHDFNNILTTINGYAEMLASAAPPDSQLAADLAEILGAGRRAALLTRQLLAFSRRAPSETTVLDLRMVARSLQKMLRRTLGEDLLLSIDAPPEPVWVDADPTQLDQVIMNLAVNARDAMPGGGELRVSVRAAELEHDLPRLPELVPAGRYALLSVADDGVGMDAATLTRVFEPFFTTKERGKGTGLGLATVFGIAKQHKGFVTVDSAPGCGSTFTVYLPLAAEPAAAPAPPADAADTIPRGDETVLVVEDQENLLNLIARALTAQGYQVLTATGGESALEKAAAKSGPIHLLLTDVVMPGLRGDALARRFAELRPETKLLFMSGYTEGRLDIEGVPDVIAKPFTPDELCRRVRAALDA